MLGRSKTHGVDRDDYAVMLAHERDENSPFFIGWRRVSACEALASTRKLRSRGCVYIHSKTF